MSVKMKIKRSIVRVLTVLMMLSVACSAVPMTAYAAAKPDVRFCGTIDGSQLTVSVSVANHGAALDSGMFVLKYDTGVLNTSVSKIKVQGGAQKSATYFSAGVGYIGLDWHYPKRLAASSNYTDIASVTFTIRSGKSVNKLSDVLSVFMDKNYLKTIGGYHEDGGLLLCSGSKSLAIAKQAVTATFVLSGVDKIRLGGNDRFETSCLISQTGWSSSKAVVIASGVEFADALAGVPLAQALGAPILLVDKTTLPDSVKKEVTRLGAKNVYILGGTAAVGSSIESYFKSSCTVTRIKGNNRYETAVAIAKKLESVRGGKPSGVYIASAVSFPDALAISPVAGITGSPILYSPQTGVLDANTVDYIKKSGCTTVTVLGGTAVVGASVTNKAKVGSVQSVARLYGSNRYETSLNICKKYETLFSDGAIALATGTKFPDALAGGALAAKKKIPLMLCDTGTVTANCKQFADNCNLKTVYIFGGYSAVSDSTFNEVVL